MRIVRAIVVSAAVALATVVSTVSTSASAGVSSLTSSPVTIYGAKWCSACRSLESGLIAKKISFEVIDVDDNPAAFARARAASGTGGAIPLTNVTRNDKTVWVLGADVEAVDRALRDE
ncbi:glutaredoxin family protein [Labilithrix luteola]|uniref:glutaredoxin family protein n=1 Tax=Labilithrix luteola TaxID=1391654 RepID=UPI001472C993|nr:glutaredoxin domain-containing protein [Labilithrix luteola]